MLPLDEAIAEDDRARASDHAWVVLPGDEESALGAPAGSFALDDRSFRWGGREAGPERLAEVRAALFHSIGTCSFFETVGELEELGNL